jgi:Flp pilus assembly protein TadD
MTLLRFLVVSFCFGLWGCSSVVQKAPLWADHGPIAKALSGELILGRPYTNAELPQHELFELTPEMKSFATAAVAGVQLIDKKAEALHQALMTSEQLGGRGITYSAYITNTGIDAFEKRQANCLSYTLLYVAMARYLGLKAEVNEVILPPTWDMRAGDTYLFMRHVNAKIFLPATNHSWIKTTRTADVSDIVVDLEMRRFRAHYKQKVISKDLVAAQFYSNRGMELAAEGDSRTAFLYLRKALIMSDQPSYIWSNFGSLYRRQGLLTEAEAIYLHGLKVNPRDYTIMHNLAGIYRETGDMEQYHYYQERVRKHRNANPYYIYRRALEETEKQNYPKALSLIKNAIKKEKDEVRFYRLAVTIYDALGDAENAEHMRNKVYQLSTIRF